MTITEVLTQARVALVQYQKANPQASRLFDVEIPDLLRAIEAVISLLGEEAPLGCWDYQAPTPCLCCGLPALDHVVGSVALLCPTAGEGQGTVFTLKREAL